MEPPGTTQHHRKTKEGYDRADWGKIGKEVLGLIEGQVETHSTEALDTAVENLTKITANAIDKHTPDLRPSLYAKR